jgi:hypothetical protein
MKMKELIIFALLLIALLLYVGHLSITIKPFSVSLPYWYRSLGLLLLILSLVIYNVGEHVKGYQKGLKDGSDIAIKTLLEKCDKEKGDNE